MLEDRILALSPIAWGAFPGAAGITADCGHECWISPSGVQAMLSGVITRKICVPCAYKDPDNISRLEAVPGAEDELAEIMPREQAREVIRTGLATGRWLARQAKGRRRG